MKSPSDLLGEIAAIDRMERGTLCRMKRGPGKPFYNHQTWVKGRNVVRYVPRDQVPALRQALAGYARFIRLTQAYADRIVERSRKLNGSSSSRPACRKRKPKH
jgi:hypothetical protein